MADPGSNARSTDLPERGARGHTADVPTQTIYALMGSNIRRLREAAGLTQSDLAQLMRLDGFTTWQRTTVAAAESGRRELRFGEVVALADHLRTWVPTLLLPVAATADAFSPVSLLAGDVSDEEGPELSLLPEEGANSDLAIGVAAHSGQIISRLIRPPEAEPDRWREPLLLPPGAARVHLERELATDPDLAEWVRKLNPKPDEVQRAAKDAAHGDVAKVAQALDVPPIRVALESLRLWSHGFMDELDGRVEEQVRTAGTAARSMQAVRGRINREMRRQLAAAMAEGEGR